MRQRLAGLARGHEVATAVAAAAVLGLVVTLAPAIDRVLLLVASTALLAVLSALVVWLVRAHRGVEWTTSAGTPERVRGIDRRVTALARTIDAAVAGDVSARSDLQSRVRSAAEARLGHGGPAAQPGGSGARADLGPELTAYLSSPDARAVTTDELASFITTLEEH